MKLIIKIFVLIFIIAWCYALIDYFNPSRVEPLQNNCTMNSQVNNCIVISNEAK